MTKIPWNKGRKGVYSAATIASMREARLAKFSTEEAVELYKKLSLKEVAARFGCSSNAVRRRLSPLGIVRSRGGLSKGRKRSVEVRANMSRAFKAYWAAPENKKKKRLGANNPFFGKKHNLETIARMKEKLSAMFSGANNPAWQGGKSLEAYGPGFNKKLKRTIKARDEFRCQLCGTTDDLVVHHRDCNKKNNAPDNLVTVCRRCHAGVHLFWLQGVAA
jgi:AraC-like DNA-binding protein